MRHLDVVRIILNKALSILFLLNVTHIYIVSSKEEKHVNRKLCIGLYWSDCKLIHNLGYLDSRLGREPKAWLKTLYDQSSILLCSTNIKLPHIYIPIQTSPTTQPLYHLILPSIIFLVLHCIRRLYLWKSSFYVLILTCCLIFVDVEYDEIRPSSHHLRYHLLF